LDEANRRCYGRRGVSIIVDSLKNVYTTGRYWGTVDFDPGISVHNLSSVDHFDVFILKIDSLGNFNWVNSHGSISDDQGICIDMDLFGNIYSTGNFQGIIDFNPGIGTANLVSSGASDIFIQKLYQCATLSSIDSITVCESYTWIDGITYYSNNNTATHLLQSSKGCDSLVHLNLTIKKVQDLTTSVVGTTISSNNSNATYQWLNCDNNYSEIVGETGQSFTPSLNGNYAVELTENGCVDTSFCVPINSVGIFQNDFGENLKIFPNPTNGELLIDFGVTNENITILVLDVNGKLIHSKSYRQKKQVGITIEESPGVYFLTIFANENEAKVKLIIE